MRSLPAGCASTQKMRRDAVEDRESAPDSPSCRCAVCAVMPYPWSESRQKDRPCGGPTGLATLARLRRSCSARWPQVRADREAGRHCEGRSESTRREFLVVGCGPAGATAAREAARAGVATLVLERDAVVGTKRVCAAGLRPGFCEDFDLPRSIVHCDTPRLALFDAARRRARAVFGPAHTTTREELDGTMAGWRAREGARDSHAGALSRASTRRGRRRRRVRRPRRAASAARCRRARVPRAGRRPRGSSAGVRPLGDGRWRDGLMTTLQYRVYLERPALAVAYERSRCTTIAGRDGRQIIAWMFPKRDHLSIGLGVMGKIGGAAAARRTRRVFADACSAALSPACAYTGRGRQLALRRAAAARRSRTAA